MITIESGRNEMYFLNPEVLASPDLLLMPENPEQVIRRQQERVDQNWVFREEGEKSGRFSLENERRKAGLKQEFKSCESDGKQETLTIVNRILEILAEWEVQEDIRIQIQYAAIIVGKIENLKKKEFVYSDEIRKKICTLLRNVIRLNVVEDRFSAEQIQILKDGFSKITSEKLQKEDLLQLNRNLRQVRLQTMPAWD